jgi:glycosyltransferase involved in cell wall biosynthesis
MRIAIVSDAWYPQINGVVRTLTTLERELANLDHTAKYLVVSGRRSFPLPGYKEIRLALTTPSSLGAEIREFAPDAIHLATEGSLGIAARAWCVRHSLSFTTGFHTRYPEFAEAIYGVPGVKSLLYKGLEWFHRPSKGIMVPTPSIARALSERRFNNLRVWSRGVNTKLFREYGREALKLSRPIFLCAGRVSAEKGLEDFLSLDLPGTKVVVGDGPLKLYYQNKYPRVFFTGYLHNGEYARVLSAADVFVFPSRNDTFGLVMLEALASGVPVAAFPVPGPIDLIQEGQCGSLNTDLGQAAIQALNVDRHCCRMHASAFSWTKVAAQFVSYLVPCEL